MKHETEILNGKQYYLTATSLAVTCSILLFVCAKNSHFWILV